MLDGFPRTLDQAKNLEQILREQGTPLDCIIRITVPEEGIKRLSGRRIHPALGRVYHVAYNPPKTAGLDDLTCEPLIQRPDDHEDTIRKRLAVYHQQTEPLVQFYRSNGDSSHSQQTTLYHEINGNICNTWRNTVANAAF